MGPASVLFEKPFYTKMRDALRPGGIVCTQGESLWLHLDTIRDMMCFCRDLFDTVEYANMSIPTYPAGQIGFVICTVARDADEKDGGSPGVREPKRDFAHPELKYYNREVHKAAFVLPEFARKELGQ